MFFIKFKKKKYFFTYLGSKWPTSLREKEEKVREYLKTKYISWKYARNASILIAFDLLNVNLMKYYVFDNWIIKKMSKIQNGCHMAAKIIIIKYKQVRCWFILPLIFWMWIWWHFVNLTINLSRKWLKFKMAAIWLPK